MRASSLLAAIILVLLILLLRCCREREALEESVAAKDKPVEASRAHLIIESESAGEWVDFSNMFSAQNTTTTRPAIRPGVLFQFGSYNPPVTYAFQQVEIYTAAGVDTFKAWCWIDIISDYSGRPDPPILPNEAFRLYPNHSPSIPADSIQCAIDMTNWCLRNRLINGGIEQLLALVTYWQGENGYSVAAKQKVDPDFGNEFRFTFPDPFRVNVYTLLDPDLAETMGTPAVQYARGSVDSIVVAVSPSGPTKGQTTEPPWPYP